MHDLTVADVHTYYVVAGRASVLVHNNDGPCPPEWVAKALAELAKKTQTTGRIFDANGNRISVGGFHEIVSGGREGLAKPISAFLHRILGGVNPRAQYPG